MVLSRLYVVSCVVLLTVVIEQSMGSTGKQNSSPIVTPKSKPKTTSITIRHGQSRTVDCRPSSASTGTTLNRKAPPSRPRRDNPSEEYSEYTIDTDAPPAVEFAPVRLNQTAHKDPTVHLVTARYVPAARAKKSCGPLDVFERLRHGCSAAGSEHCLITANDPSTVSGCQRRSLQLEYYCAEPDSVGMMVNMMIDDTD